MVVLQKHIAFKIGLLAVYMITLYIIIKYSIFILHTGGTNTVNDGFVPLAGALRFSVFTHYDNILIGFVCLFECFLNLQMFLKVELSLVTSFQRRLPSAHQR